ITPYTVSRTVRGQMNEAEIRQQIQDVTRAFWEVEAGTDAFMKLATGKEIGHRIADLVDETTTALLERNFATAQQRSAKGEPRARSMGDIWLQSSGIYNPINVKAGEANKNGQPNMVSLNKLVHALLKHQIDSYYLLFVKMQLLGDRMQPRVYLVDILDYLDFTTFDAGPGQIMLKEREFYETVTIGAPVPTIGIEEKIDRLISKYEDAYSRLLKNRERTLTLLRRKRAEFDVTASMGLDQSGLNLR
ncbi:MAG: hypothetical protein ACRDF4_02590, partial [Rhabdochlamydiaceae bacterium]